MEIFFEIVSIFWILPRLQKLGGYIEKNEVTFWPLFFQKISPMYRGKKIFQKKGGQKVTSFFSMYPPNFCIRGDSWKFTLKYANLILIGYVEIFLCFFQKIQIFKYFFHFFFEIIYTFSLFSLIFALDTPSCHPIKMNLPKMETISKNISI